MTPTSEFTPWQQLKLEWQSAIDQGAQLKVDIRVLYLEQEPASPAALEVRYSVDEQRFTRTFRGIPEGYDVARPE
ncbi:MAG: hypothetical protein KDI03_03500 [Anaerolineae bacterium]|nr:hypothetical protein [Anaerolineae bacterium]MCB0205180.1 hypothetical protein [Anaerolineae bacterium]MCB0253063.1 hypothetical protein [Anaerolineae bacterium]